MATDKTNTLNNTTKTNNPNSVDSPYSTNSINSTNSSNSSVMTEEELEGLAYDYINLEGYSDLRSILSVMSQEYPGQFDRRQAMMAIHRVLIKNRKA